MIFGVADDGDDVDLMVWLQRLGELEWERLNILMFNNACFLSP
jgi:hypothetical protein